LFIDSPASSTVAEARQNNIIHANTSIEDVELAGADVSSDQYVTPKGFCVLLSVDSEEKIKSIFASLEAGGRILLALQKKFRSLCYGIIVDRLASLGKLTVASNKTLRAAIIWSFNFASGCITVQLDLMCKNPSDK
jgi:uncharacterized glyoxalase superfamily protein PhnB